MNYLNILKNILTLVCLLPISQTLAGPIYEAIAAKSLDAVKAAVAEDPSCIHEQAPKGLAGSKLLYPVHLALLWGCEDIALFLLEQPNIQIELEAENNSRPLHIAASENLQHAAEKLIEMGAEVDPYNAHGNTPLVLAIEREADDIVNFLLAKQANAASQNLALSTPMMAAAIVNRPDILAKLVQAGANPNQGSDKKNTPLLLAADGENESRLEALRYLLSLDGIRVDQANDKNFTPLMVAATKNSFKSVTALLEAGANPNSPFPDGSTLLHYFTRKDRLDMFKHLLPYCDVDATNNKRETPLLWAVSKGNIPASRLLIEHGADTSVTSANGTTIWKLAKKNRFLLKACKDAQQAYKPSPTRDTNLSEPLLITKQEKNGESDSNGKKKKKKKKKKKSKLVQQLEAGAQRVQAGVRVARQVFASPEPVNAGIAKLLDPAQLEQWQKQAVLVSHKKRELGYKAEQKPFTDISGNWLDVNYTLRLYNLFAHNDSPWQEYQLNRGIDFTRLYAPFLKSRLNLHDMLLSRNLEDALKLDLSAHTPSAVVNLARVNDPTLQSLLTDSKVINKQDLLHLFNCNERETLSYGICFPKINREKDNYRTIEVRIPGEITWQLGDEQNNMPVVVELSFEDNGSDTLGPMVHRFARPLELCREFTTCEAYRYAQQYLALESGN